MPCIRSPAIQREGVRPNAESNALAGSGALAICSGMQTKPSGGREIPRCARNDSTLLRSGKVYFNTRSVVIQNGGEAEVKKLMTTNGLCMEVPSVRVYKRKKE